MAGSMSRANARQSAKRKGYYKNQPDKTKVNKVIALAKHVADYGCKRTLDKLRAVVAVDRHHAFLKTTSPRIKEVILSAAK